MLLISYTFFFILEKHIFIIDLSQLITTVKMNVMLKQYIESLFKQMCL